MASRKRADAHHPRPGICSVRRARCTRPRSCERNGEPVSTSFTQRQLRDAFGEFATGVTVITAVRPDGEPVGITANSFSSVSLEPPLLLWCLSNNSSGAVAFGPGAAFAVHVLSHEQREMAVHFARRS